MFIPATRMPSSPSSSRISDLKFRNVPKFSGEEGESSRRAEKRPLEESGEPSEQASQRLRLEDHGTDTFFKAFLNEFGEPAQPPQPPQRPVQDPNVPFLNKGFYEPFMARHGKEVLNDAVRQYTDIKTREPEKLRNTYFWIMRLLKNGANPNSEPPEVPIINRALNNGKFELVKKLRTHGAHAFPSNITLQIRQHLFNLIQQLQPDSTPQHRAAINTAIAQTIPHLNMPGMNLTIREWPAPHTLPSLRTLLHWAANKGHLPLTQTILDAGVPVDIRSENGTPLQELLTTIGTNRITIGDPLAVADVLIEHGADVNRQNDKGNPMLLQALQKGLLPLSQKLLTAGANPNIAAPVTLKTALHYAVETGNRDLTKAAVQAGADVNAKTVTDATPLIQAIRDKYLDIADLLLDHADLSVNQVDGEGRSALSHAAELTARTSDTIVAKLLEKGADPFIASKSGKTPLIYAIENNREKNIQALVLKNATIQDGMAAHVNYASQLVNQPDGNGIKPLVWAKSVTSPNASIIKLLNEYTEDPLIQR